MAIAKGRTGRMLLSSGLTATAKGIAAVVSLATAALISSSLGKAHYGIFEFCTAMAIWMGMANFGIGLGTTNLLTAAIAREDERKARAISATLVVVTFATVAVVSLILAILLWNEIGLPAALVAVLSPGEASGILLVTLACCGLQVVANANAIMLNAIQRLYLSAIWDIIGRLLALGLVYVCLSHHPSLGVIVAASIGVFAVVQTIALAWTLVMFRRWFSIDWRLVSVASCRELVSSSVGLFVIQVAFMASFQMQIAFVGYHGSPDEVAELGLLGRFLILAQGLITTLQRPVWSAYRNAAVQGDFAWIKWVFWRSTVLTLTGALTYALVILLWRDSLAARATHGAITEIPAGIAVAATGLFVIRAGIDAVSILFHATGEIRPQVYIWLASLFAAVVVFMFAGGRLGTQEGLVLQALASGSILATGYVFLVHRYFFGERVPSPAK